MDALDQPIARSPQVRDPFGGSWLAGRNSHVRVRVAMYGVLLLLLILGSLRGILAQQWQENRQLDIEVMQSVAEQVATTQRMGLLIEALQKNRICASALTHSTLTPSAYARKRRTSMPC